MTAQIIIGLVYLVVLAVIGVTAWLYVKDNY